MFWAHNLILCITFMTSDVLSSVVCNELMNLSRGASDRVVGLTTNTPPQTNNFRDSLSLSYAGACNPLVKMSAC